jgi:hypothetical protein
MKRERSDMIAIIDEFRDKIDDLKELLNEVHKGDKRVDPQVSRMLRQKMQRWTKYCILPLRRGEINCHETTADFGNGIEEAWVLYPQIAAKYFQDELVIAHNRRVAKL